MKGSKWNHYKRLEPKGVFLCGQAREPFLVLVSTFVSKSVQSFSVTHAEPNREEKKEKLQNRNHQSAPQVSKSIPCDDTLAAFCIRPRNTVDPTREKKKSTSATIDLPLSRLIQRGSCLWQKQWQVTGATKINHLLPSTANKCEHLPSHILTRSSVDAFARCIRFRLVHKWRIDSFLRVEVTADPVWSW